MQKPPSSLLVPLLLGAGLTALVGVDRTPSSQRPSDAARREAAEASLPTRHAPAPAMPRLEGLARPSRPPITPPPGDPAIALTAPKAPRKRDDPVLRGLRWLAAHQSPDGSWNPAYAPSWCNGQPQAPSVEAETGLADHDVGATGLALAAFVGEGYSWRGEHEFKDVLKRGTRWLKATQQEDGTLLTRSHPAWLWDHAVGTCALVELYGMTESPLVREPASRALHALLSRCDPVTGTWRLETGGRASEAVATLWAALPLVTAHIIALEQRLRGTEEVLPSVEPALRRLRDWLDAQTDATGRLAIAGDVGLAPYAESRALSTMALKLRLFLCRERGGPGDEGRPSWHARIEREAIPAVDAWLQQVGGSGAGDALDPLVAWMGTLVMRDLRGAPAAAWEKSALTAFVATEETTGEACALRGSWPARGGAVARLGRVGATALAVLALLPPDCYSSAPGPCLLAK